MAPGLSRKERTISTDEPSPGRVPSTVAIIMDGNGRWAEAHQLPIAEGHRAGTRALRRTVEAAIDLGIGSLVVYGFSTENWSRPQDEVSELMVILSETIERELPDLAQQGVRTRFMGRRDRVAQELRDEMEQLEAATSHLDRLHLWIAFDYGGRREIVDAARRAIAAGIAPEALDEGAFAALLYAPELPEVDLLIRASGDRRISNFLLWQAAYAELVFTETRWPDFGADDLRAAVDEFRARDRRFGGRVA